LRTHQPFPTVKPVSLLLASAAAMLLLGAAAAPTAHAQASLPFSATYTGFANISGPDASGDLFVTSTLNDPLASFGLTQALFTQTVNVFANPNTIVGTSIFQTPGGAGDALFTSYFGTATGINPPTNFVTTGGGTFLFTGGTGAFAGATGGGTWTVSADLSTNAVTTTFVGTVNTVPEPGTAALFATALLPLAGLVARRRRA
jgi:hypothetical protein